LLFNSFAYKNLLLCVPLAPSHNKKRPITFLSGNPAYFTFIGHVNFSPPKDTRFCFFYITFFSGLDFDYFIFLIRINKKVNKKVGMRQFNLVLRVLQEQKRGIAI
jgi:hypothetical protein